MASQQINGGCDCEHHELPAMHEYYEYDYSYDIRGGFARLSIKNDHFLREIGGCYDELSPIFYELDIEAVFTMCRNLIAKNPDLPVVSVGSGNAAFELYLTNWCAQFGVNINWILLDPDPSDWGRPKKVFMRPDYPTVRELLKDKPEIKHNCIVLLNSIDPRGDNYDERFVKSVRPQYIIFLTNIKRHTQFDSGTRFLKKYLDNDLPRYRLCDRYCTLDGRSAQAILIYKHQDNPTPGSEQVFPADLKRTDLDY